VHPRFMTPTWSTVVMGLVSIAFYLGLASQFSTPWGQ
jgi:hypothetical protein